MGCHIVRSTSFTQHYTFGLDILVYDGDRRSLCGGRQLSWSVTECSLVLLLSSIRSSIGISQFTFIVIRESLSFIFNDANWHTKWLRRSFVAHRLTHICRYSVLIYICFFSWCLFTFSAAESWAGGPGLSAVHRAAGGAWCADHSIRWRCGYGQRAWLPPASRCASFRRAWTLCRGVGIYSWCRPRCASSAWADPSNHRADAGCRRRWLNRRAGGSCSSCRRYLRCCYYRRHRCCSADDSWRMKSQRSAMRTRVDRCDRSTRMCDGNPSDDWWVGRCVGARFIDWYYGIDFGIEYR